MQFMVCTKGYWSYGLHIKVGIYRLPQNRTKKLLRRLSMDCKSSEFKDRVRRAFFSVMCQQKGFYCFFRRVSRNSDKFQFLFFFISFKHRRKT